MAKYVVLWTNHKRSIIVSITLLSKKIRFLDESSRFS